MAENEITALLQDDDPQSFDRAVGLVYDEMRRLARFQRRRGGPGPQTLNTTALVHEAYLKLAGRNGKSWKNRGHFLAVAARAVRSILVDYVRSQRRQKRGGDAVRVELLEGDAIFDRRADELLALNQALDRLGENDPRAVRVVECRYFAGMTTAETAAATGVSAATVERDWRIARARLRTLLEGGSLPEAE